MSTFSHCDWLRKVLRFTRRFPVISHSDSISRRLCARSFACLKCIVRPTGRRLSPCTSFDTPLSPSTVGLRKLHTQSVTLLSIPKACLCRRMTCNSRRSSSFTLKCFSLCFLDYEGRTCEGAECIWGIRPSRNKCKINQINEVRALWMTQAGMKILQLYNHLHCRSSHRWWAYNIAVIPRLSSSTSTAAIFPATLWPADVRRPLQ